MHTHLVNASIQAIPLVQDKHPYLWVDEVITLIQQSGLTYLVGPFGTTVQGTYPEVRNLVDAINNDLSARACPEWLLNVQWQFKTGADSTFDEKLVKYTKP
jgi:uncharacterized protein YqgV (UPF0045/DUF77 family)